MSMIAARTPLELALQIEAAKTLLDDDSRELLIDHHAACMKASAMYTDERSEHWARMRDLIDGRSTECVERLERIKGLRA